MKKIFIKLLAYIAMVILLVLIALPISIIWNGVLISDMVYKNIKRRTKAGMKEVRKTDEHK